MVEAVSGRGREANLSLFFLFPFSEAPNGSKTETLQPEKIVLSWLSTFVIGSDSIQSKTRRTREYGGDHRL